MTVESLTGGGGRHELYAYPAEGIRSTTRIGGWDGLDVRSDGGYIVAPPSLHVSGRRYEWEISSHPEDTPLASAPQWLLDLLTQRGDTAPPSDESASYSGRILEGERNSTLASLAGTMRRRGMSQGAIYAALLEENADRCDPPLPETEVRRIAESIARYEPEDPSQTGSGTSFSRLPTNWPQPLAEAAFHGLAGDIVRTIEPHSEADPAALLVQLLVAFGNVIGRKPHFTVEADYHALNLFAVLVGESSKGRKGTSWGQVRRLFEKVDPDWAANRVKSGLSTGEGLIWEVRDPIERFEED